MHHQRVLNRGDGPDPLAVGVIGKLQLVGEPDGHDVVVDSVADEELVVQSLVLDLESKVDSAKGIEIEISMVVEGSTKKQYF